LEREGEAKLIQAKVMQDNGILEGCLSRLLILINKLSKLCPVDALDKLDVVKAEAIIELL
jgi:hypothetical protein